MIELNLPAHYDPQILESKSEQINGGLSADKTALQIIKAIQHETYEAYVGKFMGEEWLALFVKRVLPRLFTRLIPKFGTPK